MLHGINNFDYRFREKRSKIQSPENIALWQQRIHNQIDWLSHRWNGYGSWTAAYLLDRTVHWANTGIKTTAGSTGELDFASENRPSKATFPLISTHVRNLVPHLISEEPLFYADAPNENVVDEVLFSMDYLNAEWRSRNITKQVRRSVLDAAIIGHGIVKTGWMTQQEITESDSDEGKIHLNSSIVAEHPWAYRVNPFLFLYDTSGNGRDLESGRWCCEIIPRRLGAIINNDEYDSQVREKLRKEVISVTTDEDFFSKFFARNNSWLKKEYNVIFEALKNENNKVSLYDMPIILYELWDKQFEVAYTMVHGFTDKALQIRDWPHRYLDGGIPYVKFDFEEVPNEAYGIGHAWYLADTQRTMNRAKTKVIQIVENFNPMWIVKGEELDPQEEEKLIDNRLGGVVRVPLNSAIELLDIDNVGNDMYRLLQILDQDYSELTGQDVLSRGGNLPSRTSAEEIRDRRTLRGLRLETSVTNSRNAIKEIALQILKHAQNNMTQERLIKPFGRAARFWNTVGPDILNASTEFELDIQVTTKDNSPPEEQRRALMEVLQMLTNPNILQIIQAQQVPFDIGNLIYSIMNTFNRPELLNVFPQMTIPQDLELINTGSPSNVAGNNTQPESTTNIQRDNVQPQSNNAPGAGVNLQSILNQFQGGGGNIQ